MIRHAKSSWANVAQDDFDRPLNERGKKDGKRMIRWMHLQAGRPTQIISSDAERARATAMFVREGFDVSADRLHFDHRLYEASAEKVLEVLRDAPDDCTSVALVGHNPGSHEFVNAMAGKHALDSLPTFGIVHLRLPLRWIDARFGCAEFVSLQTPKTLRD